MVTGKDLQRAGSLNLVLTGFMGTGKTAAGKILAHRLKRRFIDTDLLVEEMTGLSVSRIFKQHGEEGFRCREKKAVLSLEAFTPGTLVVATGGGVVLSRENMDSLESHGIIILLTASPAEIVKRIRSGKRPLLKSGFYARERVCSLLMEREPYYSRNHRRVDTSGKEPYQVAGLIIDGLGLNCRELS